MLVKCTGRSLAILRVDAGFSRLCVRPLAHEWCIDTLSRTVAVPSTKERHTLSTLHVSHSRSLSLATLHFEAGVQCITRPVREPVENSRRGVGCEGTKQASHGAAHSVAAYLEAADLIPRLIEAYLSSTSAQWASSKSAVGM